MSEGEPTVWRARASRLAGRVARSPGSRWLIPWFRRHYGIVMDDVAAPAKGFQSLQQFFCRPLRPECRPICADAEAIVSPADGRVSCCGTIAKGELVQAKGRHYTLAALLGDPARAEQFVGGTYCTIYLAPADYHRVHAPASGLVREARYIPGAHWPVNERAVEQVEGLFAVNERLITYLDTALGEIAVVMVGACLVGGIRVNYDAGWNAGPGPHTADRRRYDPAHGFSRGQELGRFEFGSTVIVLTAPGRRHSLSLPGAPPPTPPDGRLPSAASRSAERSDRLKSFPGDEAGPGREPHFSASILPPVSQLGRHRVKWEMSLAAGQRVRMGERLMNAAGQ